MSATSNINEAQPVTNKFYETFFAMPVPERQRIADDCGLSLPYILKQTYTKNRSPVFRFANAVALDKASGGRLQLIDICENSERIDWDYVERRLRSARRAGRIVKRSKKAAL